MSTDRRGTILVLSQTFVPDPAAVGQYMADVATELARRGWRVVVLTSNRGYDDPSRRYPRREVRDGVEIIRLPLSSLGKRRMAIRLIGALLFVMQASLRGLFTRRLRAVLVSTSPPMCPLAALVIAAVRGVPFTHWAMDINPDQMVALGRVRPGALPARLFEAMNRAVLKRAKRIVTLDRFMADRLRDKHDAGDRLVVHPLWALDHHLSPVPHAENPFRREHGLNDKIVFMYSGNLTEASPLTTIFEAALRLNQESRNVDPHSQGQAIHDARIMFVFIGAGGGRAELDALIEKHQPTNVLALPYQPLEYLRYSLSAADVHIVSMGEAMVGIVHPSKVYGAIAVARPVLVLGPVRCHLNDLVRDLGLGWRVAHGDVDGAVRLVRQIAAMDAGELCTMGERGRATVGPMIARETLCPRFAEMVEP